MSKETFMITSPQFIFHPVTQALGLTCENLRPTPTAQQIAGSQLIIFDCRQLAAEALGNSSGLLVQAVRQGKAILCLDPGAAHVAALQNLIQGCPSDAKSALFARGRGNSCGQMNFEVLTLSYPAIAASNEQANSASQAQQAAGTADLTAHACSCSKSTSLAQLTAALAPASIDRFAARVLYAVEHERKLTQDTTIPTGLQYFLTTITDSASFTYSNSNADSGYQSNSSAGSIDLSWTVWGFLNQTATSNSQILVIEAAYGLSPGGLDSNDSDGRGYLNCYLNASADPSLSALEYQPTSGDDSWSGTISLPISYLSPTGGYQIWTFSDGVSNSISSWSVQNISSSASLGSQWYMNSPVAGNNVSDDWKDAFSFWGTVNDMPNASTGTLSVNAISAWSTTSLKNGTVSIPTQFAWQGAIFYGTSCFLGTCMGIHYASSGWTWSPSYSVNFSAIYPS